MTRNVKIINCGIGNIKSTHMAFEAIGSSVEVINAPNQANDADMLILPGVGAFSRYMEALATQGWVDAIKEFLAFERPILGICVGMQSLFEESSERGTTRGLEILSGKVIQIPHSTSGSNGLRKLPFVNWSPVTAKDDVSAQNLFSGIGEGAFFYFVHSMMAVPQESSMQCARAQHESVTVCAAVAQGHIYGTQFHPEKSGPDGLKLLQNFISKA